MHYEVITSPQCDGKIISEVVLDACDVGGVRKLLTRRVTDTMDPGVRNALIQLGWTPPKQET